MRGETWDANWIIWIFFILIALQPVIRQKMLEAARLRLLSRFERERNSRVITLIHRQETMSFLGFPLSRFIDIDDSEAVLRAIKMTDDDVPIDLIVHSPGGLVLAAEQIAYALLRHPAKVTVFIPHYAMSGGTLIALAADEIVMDDNAVLGPVDPQLGHQPAASILSVVDQKPIDKIDDETLIMADVARKAMRQVKQTVLRLLEKKMTRDQAERTAEQLCTGVYTHDYPITVDEAREMGLPITTNMPDMVYQIMALYPQAMQRRPSVEYLPTPRSREPQKPATP